MREDVTLQVDTVGVRSTQLLCLERYEHALVLINSMFSLGLD